MRTAPMRHPTARRELLPVAVNSSGVVARPVGVVIANAGAYDRTIIGWTVIVGIWITVIVVRIRPIIACRIITSVVCYVRPLSTSAQKSCHQPCAKDRQQRWSATLGFHFRFHEISPFSILISPCPTRPLQLSAPCWSLRRESRQSARCFIVRFESGASIGCRPDEISGTLRTAARRRGLRTRHSQSTVGGRANALERRSLRFAL